MIGVVVACGLLEAGFRVAGAVQGVDYRIYLQELKNPNALPLAIWAPSPGATFGNMAERAVRRYPPFRPSAQVLATTADFSAIYQVNTRGLRDREYAVQKPPGVRRILAFGDSFTFGTGVAAEERFTEVAENGLEHVEILNMGVPGYGLDQIVLSFLAQGRAWQPDDVIVFLNSHVANRHLTGIASDGTVRLPDDLETVELTGDTGGTLCVGSDDALRRSGRNWLERHSYALAFLSYRLQLRAFQERAGPEAEDRWRRQKVLSYRPIAQDPVITRRQRTRLLVEFLRDAVRDAGARLTIVNIDRRFTAEYLSDVEGITLVDLASELHARGKDTELSFRYDQHYNPDTHRWLGERLISIVTAR